ncbi:transmembrane anchor protein [Oceanicola sp. 22II-s10i]|uniref:transmembrane anchor protein n=1 Tax=Oceanicola sp. 22II-s10i TaxID=1317116 RepID=UPI000B526213|nr:transmembrane anchor protein [Oceanicola sp. 22II-s10i]OWU84528.1 transmembrane anchor protein [Oceanicola sp. 22II-s10i]
MHNAQKPALEDLPTTRQLLKSTAIAAASAVVILVTVVLPAEYGIDPTRVGGVLGLTEMGEIKQQLAEEKRLDEMSMVDARPSLWADLAGLFVGSAAAQDAPEWRDETIFMLAPGESAEWKMEMTEGQVAQYRMTVEGGRVNFDLHGHGGGKSVTYEKGRGSTGEEGEITAAFDGDHGWFWRNRDSSVVTVTVQVRGDYQVFKDAS